MKSISVTFEDEEMEMLVKKKGKRSWREFILTLIGDEELCIIS
jgi:predicted CopG family antitoxin